MTAEVIAIGSELTCGARLDTNSQWLSHELEALGWTVTRHTSLGDDLDSIVAEFRAAAARSEVVLITGGLGPTLDDITRDALAAAFNQPLVPDQDSLIQIQALFAARGRPMPERNQRQAMRPENAIAIPNTCGTAPGILMRVPRRSGENNSGICIIGVLPGVPAEMKPMFSLQLRTYLTQSRQCVLRTVIRTFGYGESDAERLLGDLTARGRNPEVGITASEAVISLSITSRAATRQDCESLNAQVRAQILDRLKTAVYAEDDRELHEVVGDRLFAAGKSISLIEGSTTGGLIACWMTEEQRHASCLASAQIDTAQKLPTGSHNISEWEQYAAKCASPILQSGAADYVLLSSPQSESVSENGTRMRHGMVAVVGRLSTEVHDVSMTGNLAIFRQRAARTALNRLRLALIQDSGSCSQPD